MNAADIRDMVNDDIEARIAELQEELFRLRFRSATQPLENPALIRQIKRDLARMKTVLRERELAGE